MVGAGAVAVGSGAEACIGAQAMMAAVSRTINAVFVLLPLPDGPATQHRPSGLC